MGACIRARAATRGSQSAGAKLPSSRRPPWQPGAPRIAGIRHCEVEEDALAIGLAQRHDFTAASTLVLHLPTLVEVGAERLGHLEAPRRLVTSRTRWWDIAWFCSFGSRSIRGNTRACPCAGARASAPSAASRPAAAPRLVRGLATNSSSPRQTFGFVAALPRRTRSRGTPGPPRAPPHARATVADPALCCSLRPRARLPASTAGSESPARD